MNIGHEKGNTMTVIAIILSYLLGAIPFGYIVTKSWKKVDVRQHGSGNIGFTNTLRVAGKIPGLIVLLCDIGKGLLPVLIFSQLPETVELGGFMTVPALCGLAAIVGHDWPLYLKFKGGKGISTTIGVFLALDWRVTLVGLVIWLIAVIVTRYVSLGSILFVASLPVTTVVFELILKVEVEAWVAISISSAIAAVIAIYRHKGNINRLLGGKERKIGQKA